MKIVTNYIHPDEPCYGLFEGPQTITVGNHTEEHWLQWVWVVRSDCLAKYETDFGSALKFERVQPILIPGMGDDRVGDIQELAAKNRYDFYWANHRDEMLAESTLIKDHLAMLEQKLLHKQNRSHLGPHINTQRNDYSRQFLERKVRDKVNGN